MSLLNYSYTICPRFLLARFLPCSFRARDTTEKVEHEADRKKRKKVNPDTKLLLMTCVKQCSPWLEPSEVA